MPNQDAPSGDVATGDAGSQGDGEASCPAQNAGFVVGDASTPTVWYALDNPVVDDAGTRAWTTFDISTAVSGAGNFWGAAFDGRYIYLAPANSGLAVRYDTHASLSSRFSWESFDTNTLPLPAKGFSGAVFDGRYVTFVPVMENSSEPAGIVARYDTTTQAFMSASSWTTTDVLSLSPDAGPDEGYHGATFDGRFIYLAPYSGPQGRHGLVLRYDTLTGTDAGPPVDAGVADTGTADAAAHDASTDAHDTGAPDTGLPEAGPPETPPGWTYFNTATQNAAALGFVGAVYDDRYVYLVPFDNEGHENNGYSGWVSRYDTTMSFTSVSAWTSFDTSVLPPGESYGFQGAAFDGRYVYLVPDRQTVVTRLDTQGNFSSSSAWSTYDTLPLIGAEAGAAAFHFVTAGFDGRYVYFVPTGTGFGTVVRFDTFSTSFSAPCAWSTYDLTSSNSLGQNFTSVVYDGQYLYFVPSGSVMFRYDTKTLPSMPALPEFNGSFY
jgi:hypothetical protein